MPIFQKEVEYLGHVMSAEGIKPQQAKGKAMREYHRPLALRDLQAFSGVANYYMKFIEGYSNISRVLVDLTKGENTSSNKNCS